MPEGRCGSFGFGPLFGASWARLLYPSITYLITRLSGPYTLEAVLILAVYFIGAAGDHFTTGYIVTAPGGGQELSPLYNLLKNRITIQAFVNLSFVIKAVGGLLFFMIAPSLMILPALVVCAAPTFNMFWLWNAQRATAGAALAGKIGVSPPDMTPLSEAAETAIADAD